MGAAVTLAAALALAGCFTGPREVRTTAPTAEIVGPQCPNDGVGLVTDASLTGGGRAPDDFVITRAVRCEVSPQGQARDGGIVFLITQETGPAPATLLDALSLPDQVGMGPGVACPADQPPFRYLLLVDRDDRAYRPRLPIQPCARVRVEVAEAIDAIDWQAERSFTVTRPD